MEEIIKNMVWISTEEYKELIETKCKAEADADRRLSEWSNENRRAERLEKENEALRAKLEEYATKIAEYERRSPSNGAIEVLR